MKMQPVQKNPVFENEKKALFFGQKVAFLKTNKKVFNPLRKTFNNIVKYHTLPITQQQNTFTQTHYTVI